MPVTQTRALARRCCGTGAGRRAAARCPACCSASAAPREVWLIDYGAGNVRSVRNAVARLGFTVRDVESAADLAAAPRLLFPGVGAFGSAMDALRQRGLVEPLRDYLQAGRPFLGICLGLQLLYEGSEESGGVAGLGLIPGTVARLPPGERVPNIGWAGFAPRPGTALLSGFEAERFYYVHSFAARPCDGWTAALGQAGAPFAAAVARGDVAAVQFHPEKSGAAGLRLLGRFLEGTAEGAKPHGKPPAPPLPLSRRVIACLDVRADDAGRLVVTKARAMAGSGYDVRDKASGAVVNVGDPAQLAARYAAEGADEVTFLNITGYRGAPLGDVPMLALLRAASASVFVPLTVGGGIRALVDSSGASHTAVDVAAAYFRSGADKVSIGSDAVAAAEAYYAAGGVGGGGSSIEQISARYGAQAVVVSIDPRRVYVSSPADTRHAVLPAPRPGPAGETLCWYQCTVAGGREGRDVSAQECAVAAVALGAGEILLNCIDEDGRGEGFDAVLVEAVAQCVAVPVIASSGAGRAQHFADVFAATHASAALAAGIFHRDEVSIAQVKAAMKAAHIPTRALDGAVTAGAGL